MDINEVLQHLPHRYPFLLIDRVTDYKPGEYLIAIKNVSVNEPFFQGHFPNRPLMPGVLVVEAMAQACGILSFKTMNKLPGKDELYLFLGIDRARFKRPVGPGDQLEIRVSITRQMHSIWKFDATAKVEGEVCCSAELMCTFKEF